MARARAKRRTSPKLGWTPQGPQFTELVARIRACPTGPLGRRAYAPELTSDIVAYATSQVEAGAEKEQIIQALNVPRSWLFRQLQKYKAARSFGSSGKVDAGPVSSPPNVNGSTVQTDSVRRNGRTWAMRTLDGVQFEASGLTFEEVQLLVREALAHSGRPRRA